MKYQLLLRGDLPCPLGPRDLETAPNIGDVLTAEINGANQPLEVVAITHLPVIPGGTFAHDEAYVICRLVYPAL